MWRDTGMCGQAALAGLLSIIASASATVPTGYVFSSDNNQGGAICDTTWAVFDCFDEGTGDSSGCDSYTTLQSCTDKCDTDPMCRWVMYGLDSSNGEYYRCINFMACPTKYPYEAGEPKLYYKPPEVEEPTYDLIFTDTFCLGGNTLFDCQVSDNLLQTYQQCHPEYYTAAGCQAACEERSDCNFMFWGYDNQSDYFRCALFDTCSPSTAYQTGDPNVYRKQSGSYPKQVQDSTCPTEHVLFDCVVVGGSSAVNLDSCAPYSTQPACEAKCNEAADCRFYTWGWDERGHWRCTTFTSCEQPTSYATGSPTVYRRPTIFTVLAEQSFCSNTALFDCEASTDPASSCDKFDVLATCEAICDGEPTCAYMAWGKDSSRGWRCATFTECGWMSSYEGSGLVSVYSRAGATPVPAPDPFCLKIVTGQSVSDGGTLSASIDTGSGLEAAALDDSNSLGDTVFDKCFATPVRALELANPSNDAWAGTIDYSEDAGVSYRRMICETCTVIDMTSKFVVDGNEDETDLAPTQCSNGESCRFVPREQYCVKIVTGAGAGGELSAVVYGWSALWTVPGGVVHDADAYIGERCFDQPVWEMYLNNTGAAWSGSVTYSTDYGLNYGSLNCTACSSEDTSSITVDAAAGLLALTPRVSVGSSEGCTAAVPDASDYQLLDVGGGNMICSVEASFDCNPEELLDGGSCAQYSSVSDCQETCDEDRLCQFFAWGWDAMGYNRCMTFPSCTYQENYHLGNPSIYRKLNYDPSGQSNGATAVAGWSPAAAATLVAFFLPSGRQ